MLAYANPPQIQDEKQRADGYGLVRFKRSTREITFECWPRFSDSSQGDSAQFPGWPITVSQTANDGRKPVAWLPLLKFKDLQNPVVQVVEESTGEIVYTMRTTGQEFQPPVYRAGKYTVHYGQ